jgi:ribosomal protein L16 Arg81 hydroxylase
MIKNLTDLLAPVSVENFLDSFRASRRLYIKATARKRAESLLSWQEIDTLLSVRAHDDKLRIMRDGVAVPKKFFTSQEGKRFNVRAFHDLVAQGVSIVVDRIDYSIPQIGRLTVAIERELGVDTWVNGYLSFSKGGAFKPHWDGHDVLVVQIHGKKQWRIWNAEMAHPLEKEDRTKVNASSPPDQEIEFGPGDVLFIPRGEPHSAAVSTEHSVHLTIGLSSLTGLDLLDQLRKEAADDPLLRANLPRHSSETEANIHEAAVKRHLHQLIDAASVSRFLQAYDLSRRHLLQTAVSGALPQMDDIMHLTLRRRIPLPDIAPDEPPQPVMIGGEVCRLAPASIGAMRWFFDHDPTTRRALDEALSSQYGQAAIEAALRELLRFGFLAVTRAR